MSPTYGCASHTQSALGCCRRSSLSQFGKLWGKWACKTNGWTIVPENKFSRSIVFNHKSCIATICLRADNSTTPPPTERSRLWVQKKREVLMNFSFEYPTMSYFRTSFCVTYPVFGHWEILPPTRIIFKWGRRSSAGESRPSRWNVQKTKGLEDWLKSRCQIYLNSRFFN